MTEDIRSVTLTAEELKSHLISTDLEPAFVTTYPEAPHGKVYEFSDRADAEKARVTLLTTAWTVGRGRVTRIYWPDSARWRVIATP